MKAKTYATRDLALAAALCCNGAEVIELEHFKDRSFTFVTDLDYHTGKAQEYKYYNEQFESPQPYVFYQEIRKLKGRIYEEMKKRGLA